MTERRSDETRQPDEIIPHEATPHQARKGMLKRLVSWGTAARLAGYTFFDFQPHVAITVWSAADIAAVTLGSMDIVAGVCQHNRDAEERVRLIVRGGLKIGAGALPYVPSAPAVPIIDAISEVDRNQS